MDTSDHPTQAATCNGQVGQATLLVTTRYPFAAYSGARCRLESIALAGAVDGAIDLLCLAPRNHLTRNVVAERRFFRNVHLIDGSLMFIVPRIVQALMQHRSAQEGLYFTSGIARWLDKHSHQYGATIFHLIRAGQYLPWCHSRVRILEMTDALSLAYLRRSIRSSPLAQTFWAQESVRCLVSEARQIKTADAAVLVSPLDRNYLATVLGGVTDKLTVIPLGAHQALFEKEYRPTGPSICFVGSMWFDPNIVSCEWFCKSVLPLMRAQYPDFALHVIGHGPRNVLARIARFNGVTVHGFVADIAPVALACTASVAPIAAGSGLQTKIIESMAMGLPVLCSPMGADPLRSYVGDELLVCATPEEYVKHFTRLVESPSYRSDVSRRSRETAQREFHVDVVIERYRRLIGQPE